MSGEKKGTLRITVILYILMFLYAVFTTMPGTQLLVLTREFGLALSEGGIFTVAVNGGCILGILVSVCFLDRYDEKHLVLVSYLLFGVMLAGIWVSRTYGVFLIFLILAGAGMKFFDSSVNACVSKLNQKNSGFYMNLLHCSFGIGAFVGPVFTTVLTDLGFDWRQSYLFLGITILLACVVYGWVQRGYGPLEAQKEPVVDRERKETGRSVFQGRVFWLMGLLLCYCGHQIGINSWLPAYMQEEMGRAEAVANLSVSAFWIGLIVSRLVSAVLTKRMPEAKILTRGLLAGSVLLLAGIISRNFFLTMTGVVAAGLFAGAAIPLTLTIGYGWFPERIGKISTLLFLCIAGGAVVLPWLMGMCVEVGGLYLAMVLDGVSLAGAAGIALVVERKYTQVC